MRADAVATARTFLFVPGNRPDRFEKALRAGADTVVFDLEDAVPADEKERARDLVVAAVRATKRPVVVRINGADTPWHADDARAVVDAGAHIMLPKAESTEQIQSLAIPSNSAIAVIALIETPLGVLNAVAIAEVAEVSRLAFGSLDFAAALGVDPDHRAALAAARSQLVLASAAAGLVGPVDGVTQAVRDTDALSSDVQYAKALGFAGKLCVHPAQPECAARLLEPSAEEISWATRVLEATSVTEAGRGGVAILDGRMIDPPVIRRAEFIMAAVNDLDDCD